MRRRWDVESACDSRRKRIAVVKRKHPRGRREHIEIHAKSDREVGNRGGGLKRAHFDRPHDGDGQQITERACAILHIGLKPTTNKELSAGFFEATLTDTQMERRHIEFLLQAMQDFIADRAVVPKFDQSRAFSC